MEPQDQQASGDYGYDLAHEEVARSRPPGDRPDPEHRGSSPAGRPTDTDQDYGYDEAHSF